MKCMHCGSTMKERKEDYDYGACGLPVMLLHVTVRRCPSCDETEVSIPQVEELHRVLAEAVTRKTGRLVGAEIRFLRSWLGLSGRRFARRVGATPETVSRWENDKLAISCTHERLLRLMAAQRNFFAEYDIATLLDAEHDRTKGRNVRMKARVTGHRWELAA